MSNEYLQISFYQNKIDKNIRSTIILRYISIFFMPMPIISVFVSRLLNTIPDQKNGLWVMSLLFIVASFLINVYLIKKNNTLRWELYYLEKESLERKKRVAKIRGETLSDYVLDKEVKEPIDNATLPIPYYGILLIIDIVIKFMILDAI